MRDLHFSHFVVEMTKTRIIRLLNKPDNKKCTLFSLKKKYANILCWKSFYFYFVFFFNNSFLFVQRFYPQINFSLVIWKKQFLF